MAPSVPDPRDRPAGRPQRGHGRPGPARASRRPRRARSPRCEQAIADLDRQRAQCGSAGARSSSTWSCRRPSASARRVRAALEAELPRCGRPWSAPASTSSEDERRRTGWRRPTAIGRRGSHGVMLKAPDHPRSSTRSTRSRTQGIPVVTLVTDVPLSRRLAYVGIDNRAAGATAAYLLTQWSASGRHGAGDAEQLARSAARRSARSGFRAAMREHGADRAGPRGQRHRRPRRRDARRGAARSTPDPSIDAVYSIGGGNRRDRSTPSSAPAGLPRLRRPRPRRRQPRPCCAGAGSPRCSTTTCAPTCAAPAGWSCRRHGALPGTPQTVPSHDPGDHAVQRARRGLGAGRRRLTDQTRRRARRAATSCG